MSLLLSFVWIPLYLDYCLISCTPLLQFQELLYGLQYAINLLKSTLYDCMNITYHFTHKVIHSQQHTFRTPLTLVIAVIYFPSSPVINSITHCYYFFKIEQSPHLICSFTLHVFSYPRSTMGNWENSRNNQYIKSKLICSCSEQHHEISCSPALSCLAEESSLCPHRMCYQPVNHLVVLWVIRLTVALLWRACIQVTFILLNIGLKAQEE